MQSVGLLEPYISYRRLLTPLFTVAMNCLVELSMSYSIFTGYFPHSTILRLSLQSCPWQPYTVEYYLPMWYGKKQVRRNTIEPRLSRARTNISFVLVRERELQSANQKTSRGPDRHTCTHLLHLFCGHDHSLSNSVATILGKDPVLALSAYQQEPEISLKAASLIDCDRVISLQAVALYLANNILIGTSTSDD